MTDDDKKTKEEMDVHIEEYKQNNCKDKNKEGEHYEIQNPWE